MDEMLPNKKSSIILVLRILEEYSDEEHYLTQKDILEKIANQYGIDLERKSIRSSLKLLSELGYDIAKGHKGGFALLSRTFDPTEASFLVDAIFSSHSIDGKMARNMCEEISNCFSKYQRKDYSYLYKSLEVNRTNNNEVLFNISIIHEAIRRGKKISFQYLGFDNKGKEIARRDDYRYLVSPYYLINNFGRYYLLCNYKEKYDCFQTFRIDYMLNIETEEDNDLADLHDLDGAPKDFSITKYINDHIYLFGGETIEAELLLDDAWCIQYIKDWFGNNSSIIEKNGEIHAYIKSNENALYYWAMQYSNHVKVLAPSSLVDRIKGGLIKALDKYK